MPRKSGIPVPVFADIATIGRVLSAALLTFSEIFPFPRLLSAGLMIFALIPLLSSKVTIKFKILTFLLTSQMSVLFSKKISFWVSKSTLPMISRTVSQVLSKSRVRSTIPSTTEASEIFLNVLSIPIFSTTSSVSRSPAVSMNRNMTPSMLSVSSIVSRVVP